MVYDNSGSVVRIACLAVTPKWHGGVETAFAATVDGLRELGHEVDVIGCVYRSYKSEEEFREKSGWREWAFERIDKIVLVKSHEDLENALADYDGVVISDVYFTDRFTPDVLLGSSRIAPWTSGWHTNMARKEMVEFHEQNASSPAWSGAFASFWASAEKTHEYARWHRTVLPFRAPETSSDALFSDRPYDFILAARIDPRKGIVTYVSGLEGLARRGVQFNARLAGTPIDFPGGPYSNTIAAMLEKWGWSVHRDTPKLKSNWTAVDSRTGSELHYTGNYEPSERESVLSSAKRFINATSGVASNSHLEYSTLEALVSGCAVLAKTDWDTYHYPDEQPVITDLPEKSYRIRRGSKLYYNSCTDSAVDKIYDEFTDVLERELANSPSDDDHAATVAHNRRVVESAHDPKRAASTYAQIIEDARDKSKP